MVNTSFRLVASDGVLRGPKGPGSGPPAPDPRRRGLVCAGGGIMGAIYEMGVLAALDERLEGPSLNELDVYVGISAGSYVSTLLASGVPPAVLLRSVSLPAGSRTDLDDLSLFRPNWDEFLWRLARAPRVAADALASFARNPREVTLTDLVASLATLLPSGFFTLAGMEEWLERWLGQPGRTNDFRKLKRALRCVAVELDTGEIAPFGAPGYDDVPISKAVIASCALPGLYRPVRIGDTDYIDGGVKKTAHISLALAERCGLVVCVNPIVPVRFRSGHITLPSSGRSSAGALRTRGLLAILDQVFRLTLHSRMVYGLARYRREFPDSDIVVFEPRPEDLPRFMRNIMRTSGRVEIAEFAYRSTMERLDEEYSSLSRVFSRHGLTLRPSRAARQAGRAARRRAAASAPGT